jgi:hypothetical protein
MGAATPAEEAWTLAFGDLPLEAGIALREGTAWRHFPAPDRDRYRGLLSVADLDAFLRTAGAAVPRVSMADSGQQGSAAVPEEAYAGPDGRVDLPRLLARFDAGATLVVSQFHEIHPPLARFCRGLEKAFLHAVQANIYLTPPGARGFRVHYDTHDVLVLQIAGAKDWRLWDRLPVAAPTRRTPHERRHQAPEEPPHEVRLRPGDALYVPRGVLHDAQADAAGEASLHATIGLLEPSWAEAMRALVDQLELEEPALRASFPTWRLADPLGTEPLVPRAAPLAALLARPEAVERMALWALDRLAADRLALPGRGLLTRPPGPEQRLRISALMHHHLVPQDSGAALRWSDGVELLSAAELGWLERLEEGATPAELGEGALEFCRRLAAQGLLERAG